MANQIIILLRILPFIRNDDIYYGFSSNGQIKNRIVPNVRSAKIWQHVAFTFDGSEAKLYLDGEVIDSTVSWVDYSVLDSNYFDWNKIFWKK